MDAEDYLQQEIDKLENYQRLKKELKEKNRGLGRLGYLRYFPYPKQVLGAFTLGVCAVALLLLWPMFYTQFLESYVVEQGARNVFMAVLLYALGITAMFMFVMVTGGIFFSQKI